MSRDAELMEGFLWLRKQAYAKLASPLRDAALEPYEQETHGLKTAAEHAAVDKAIFLHKAVP